MLSAAERLPAAVGQNFTLWVQLAPGASTCTAWQVSTPPQAKSPTLAPVKADAFRVTGELPLLVNAVN
jgi:hypothetical protein